MRRGFRQAGAAVLLAVALVASVAGCTGGTPGDAPDGRSRKPGIEKLGGDRVLAHGWVARQDIEGGFWALMDEAPSERSDRQPRLVAVLLPGKVSEQDIARLEATFIGAEGKLAQGQSIRMSGPEVIVDAVRVETETR